MSQMQLAQRYAKALFEVTQESGKSKEAQEQLAALKDTLFSKENLASFFSSPLVRPLEKEAAIKEALEKTSTGEEIKSFLNLLARKGRLTLFPEVVEAFQRISDNNSGVVRGKVKSPKELNADEKKALQSRIQAVTKKNPELIYEVHPELIGGMVAEVGNYTFDDSLAGHLTRMKEQLNRSAQ